VSDQIRLDATTRPAKGKGVSGRLRREGRVPAIVYGHEVEPTAVSVDARALYHALHTPARRNVLIDLVIDGESYLAVARDVQTDPVRGDYLHIDFLAVDRDVRIQVDVPIHLVDDDQRERDGGEVNHALHAVTILVRPLDTPNAIEVSLAGMAIGDSRRVEDLTPLLPAGAELVRNLEDAVVVIDAPRTAEPAAGEPGEAGGEAGAGAESAADAGGTASEG
jgi:large subunit ribosomal protein L25